MTDLLIVDNYDSFVYNIAQYLGEMGATIVVERNDSPRLDQLLGRMDGYVVSPGPGHPRDCRRSLEIIANHGYGRPVLGICLGHQAIAHVHGGTVGRASQVVHGKTSVINHTGDPIFEGVPESFRATRYHSLLVSKEALPGSIEVLAETEGREIMALRVKDRPVYGLQFHPESVMTSHGRTILGNFLRMCSR
ncbi:MAG: anthranilate/aminodeoxychorismate synthase component II [Euryarchaeota archaeon RBG_16_62_10]|nr:MAG: anthranilate/aminodeoxychorismate synthase component II [Euryarchaeota archaeon RBG_16_62_10]